MIQTEHSRRMDLEQQHSEKMEQASGEVFSALAELKSLKESLDLRNEENAELLESRDSLNVAIKQLEALRKKDEELAESYKRQISELSKIVAEQKEAADKAIELEAATNRLSKQTEHLAFELSEARESLEKVADKHATDVKRLEASYIERSQVAETRAQLAQGQAVLEMEIRLRAEKAASDTANNETIRKLYEQLDALRQQLSDAKSSSIRVSEAGSPSHSEQNDGTK
ncbi:hypothetical protein GZH47_31625 (plasmid) [Paenibacillus rhizovicinus]|uniref:Uncharacterized protein n=1 Tax=Paenibacillus rhizovicinus TaxID=2704463 RepID=A0A6C0PA09_9BACL|nr:hypothetical protein [Paenibacillus rhizovicinus]QHW35450.1 hypothetical protein GZH47_31625 [Paenibacillus rhizovicinus]